jgi:Flp pilus assembly protein TadG
MNFWRSRFPHVAVENLMSRLKSLAADFAHNREGSVAIIFGLSCIVLFGLIGLATDTSRYYNYTAQMQSALDAATLAGAKILPDPNTNDNDIKAVIEANFNQFMTTAGINAKSVDASNITVDRSTNTIVTQGKATLPAMFASILTGNKTQSINLTSKVVYDRKTVELAMVLDITGSMNTGSKLADMKAAAKDVIDELFNASLDENSVRIALAPYSAAVNAGDLAASVTAPVPVPVNQCSTKPKKGYPCQDAAGVAIDTCVIERQGANAATAAAPVGTDVLPVVPTTPYGNYTCPDATVVPLSGKSDRDTIKAILDSYVATGSTAGHIGTAWGSYLLSPAWSGVLGTGAPAAYGNADKSMIIMTDGVFNTSYLTGGSTAATTQADESYAQFDALCNQIKADGIRIFTVGFALNDARALTELSNCASDPTTFFDAKTGDDLKKSFHSIAKKLNTLRVAG